MVVHRAIKAVYRLSPLFILMRYNNTRCEKSGRSSSSGGMTITQFFERECLRIS